MAVLTQSYCLQGDSGGPLLYQLENRRWVAIGVVSWGIRCGEDRPAIYTRVNRFLDWIVRNTLWYPFSYLIIYAGHFNVLFDPLIQTHPSLYRLRMRLYSCWQIYRGFHAIMGPKGPHQVALSISIMGVRKPSGDCQFSHCCQLCDEKIVDTYLMKKGEKSCCISTHWSFNFF